MQFYQDIMNVTITSNKQGVTPGTVYQVIGIESETKFWFINDSKEFDLIPISSCKFVSWRDDGRAKDNNRKSDGENGLLEGISKSTAKGK